MRLGEGRIAVEGTLELLLRIVQPARIPQVSKSQVCWQIPVVLIAIRQLTKDRYGEFGIAFPQEGEEGIDYLRSSAVTRSLLACPESKYSLRSRGLDMPPR